MSVNVLWESQQWFSGSGIFKKKFFYTMDCISVTKWLDPVASPTVSIWGFLSSFFFFNRKGPFTNQRASCMNRIYHFAAIAQAQQTAMKLHWCNFAGWFFWFIYFFYFSDLNEDIWQNDHCICQQVFCSSKRTPVLNILWLKHSKIMLQTHPVQPNKSSKYPTDILYVRKQSVYSFNQSH